jgi:hypothetical protein
MLTSAPCLAVPANGRIDAQANRPGDQAYVGTWTGSYSNATGASGKLSVVLGTDEKGGWRCTITYTTDEGDQSGDLRDIQIADGKLTGKLSSPDGEADIAIEGQFKGNVLEGTYAVSPKGSTEVLDKGVLKAMKATVH